MRRLPLYESPLLTPLEKGHALPLQTGACTRCSYGLAALGRKEVACIPAEGVEGKDRARGTVYVLGEAPSRIEAERGRPMISSVGRQVRAAVEKYWPGDYVLDYGIRCSVGSPKLLPQAQAACAPFLRRVFADAMPDRILVLGRQAAKTVLGRDVPPDDTRKGYSWVTRPDGKRIPLMVLMDPVRVQGNKFLLKNLEEDFAWALGPLEGLMKPPDDLVFHLVETFEDAKVAVEALTHFEWIAYDCETAGKHFSDFFEVSSVACTGDDCETTYVWGPKVLEDGAAVEMLRELMEDDAVGKVGANCLTGDSMVTLASGERMRLLDMVKAQHPGPVLTVNETTGELEHKRVVGWVKAPVRPWEDWLSIRVRGKGQLRLTRDHEVLTSRGRVRAEDVRVGDCILREAPSLSVAQRALIYGTLAGDGTLTKQRTAAARAPYLQVAHGDKQQEYAALKHRVLGTLTSGPIQPCANDRGYSENRPGTLHRVRTISDSRLFEFADKCYVDGRKHMSNAWLAQMSLPALAIWYCDDGSLKQKDGTSASMCVHSVGGAEAIVAWLHAQGFPGRVWNRPEYNHDYVIISGPYGRGMSAELRAFWEAIAPYVPTCMTYKLPPAFRHLASDAFWMQEERPPAATDVVTEIGPLLRQDGVTKRYGGYKRKGNGPTQYCLTVEGNSNFFASGLAVSNCKYDQLSLRAAFDIRVQGNVLDVQLTKHLDLPGSDATLETMSECVGMGGYKQDFAQKLRGAKESISRARKKSKGGAQLHLLPENPIYLAAINHPKESTDAYAYGLIPSPDLERYNARDTVCTARNARARHGFALVQKNKAHRNVWRSVLCNATDTVEQLEAWGIGVSREGIENFRAYVDGELAAVTRRIDKYNINPGSPQQVAELLFRKLRLVNPQSPKSQSTDAKALRAMEDQHPLIKDLREHRRLAKLRSSYGDLDKFIRSDGRIHCTYKVDGTETGRLSCVEPGLHQLPRKKDADGHTEGKLIKDCFASSPGYKLVQLDESQLELRTAAALSQDPVMLEMFASGRDFHLQTAQAIAPLFWKISPDAVTDAHRSVAKVFNFGLIYGMTDPGLAARLNIRTHEATRLRAAVLGKFRGLARWIRLQEEYARTHGHIITPLYWEPGRIRPLPDIAINENHGATEQDRAKLRARKQTAQNGSCNTPCQSLGSDIVFMALEEIVQRLQLDATLDARVVLTVHDSIVAEVREDHIERYIRMAVPIMTQYALRGVPLVVDTELGEALGSLEKMPALARAA